MRQEVRVCVLFGFGINCDRETAAVFEMVGGSSERLHVNHLVEGARSLDEFDILQFPADSHSGTILGAVVYLEIAFVLLCENNCKNLSQKENLSSVFATVSKPSLRQDYCLDRNKPH